MFFEDKTTTAVIGQLMLAVLYLGLLVVNLQTRGKLHAGRMTDMGLPMAMALVWFGFLLKLIGGVSLLIDYRADIGAIVLIVFTVTATAIFHRFWTYEEPMMRHINKASFFSNIGIVGGLVLLI